MTAATKDEPETVAVIEEGMVLDYVTGKPVKDTPKERVRQRIVRALFHEYGISVEDMVPDFKMKVDRRRKRIDLAIFAPGAEIFAKLHDEKRDRDDPPRFWAGMVERQVNGQKRLVDEQFDPEGRKAIRERVEELFAEAREEYGGTIFRGDEQITLSDRALAFMVAELAKYDFARTEVDAKGAAYQEIAGANLRGDRGQYFTPRGEINLMVRMLDPQPESRM